VRTVFAHSHGSKNHSRKEICDIVGISRNTYYKYTRLEGEAANIKKSK